MSADPTIFVNDEPRACPTGSTLLALVKELGLEGKKGVAVAVNGVVASKGEWSSKPLFQEDRVLIIQATQGG